MPYVSIVIASHNEGELLWRTVESCRDTCRDLDYEIKRTSFSYDNAGQQTAIEDARTKRTTFQYDAAGQLEAEIDPLDPRLRQSG